ncbi:hypothetical protein BC826DRAFT_162110 [Russula brevipes]|nr:hypothetical protein BC826DRAFT_162110 [Russula brevipes]
MISPPANAIFMGIGVLLTTAREVHAGHDTLTDLFERINFFLQRLTSYAEIPLTNESMELLGKIMAQILFILAISTRVVKDSQIKKFLKKLTGRTDVEDALVRLDMLTSKETFRVDLDRLELTRQLERLLLPDSSIVDSMLTRRQKASYERNSENFSPLQTLLSTITLHAAFSFVGPQSGLSKATRSNNGRRMVPYCGSVVFPVRGKPFFALPSSRTSRECKASGPYQSRTIISPTMISPSAISAACWRPFSFNSETNPTVAAMFCVTFVLRGVISPNCLVATPLKNVLRICSKS